MRQGEILALQWQDVDLKKGVLRVRRTVYNGVVNPPKSESSRRSITLTGMAREALKKHKEKGGGGEWVFSSRVGTPVSCHNLINRSWRPLLDEAGLPRIPFHNLRYTCASLLLSQGVHPKLVQELLGHADITTTLNTYSHVIPSLRGKTASAIEDVLGEEEEDPTLG
jgi:integrase